MEGIISTYSLSTLGVTVDITGGSGSYASWNIGIAGQSGISGYSGYSGISGYSGKSGYSGYSGISGYSGSGISGYSGQNGLISTGNWTASQSGFNLVFYYNGTPVVSFTTGGAITAASNITAYGAP